MQQILILEILLIIKKLWKNIFFANIYINFLICNYKLGPNGSIMTCLNLYATRFDQVMGIIEKRLNDLKYIFLDTPGQIEVFTWSASGAIITESLANTLPSCILYVVDTPRSARPATFMSNMLYACSILYKTRLPLIVVFNKTDVMSHEFAVKWMSDFEAFQKALDDEKNSSYSESLTRSLSLALDEFYHNLSTVGVSAHTGEGLDELFKCIDDQKEIYRTTYLADLDVF